MRQPGCYSQPEKIENQVGNHGYPPFDQSAMDGVAFTYKEGESVYRLVGVIAAGDPPDAIKPGPGECARIMTGAPVPSTVDTVEMVEKIQVEEDRVTLVGAPRKGQHIRFAGENMKEGELMYPAGTRITPGILAGLTSQGMRYVKVQAPIRIGIASTGDEIIDYRLPLSPGQIYNSNSPTLEAALKRPGVEIQQLGVLPDRSEAITGWLEANRDLDVIVTSGGVSMGHFDLVPGAAEKAGFQKIFHKIKMKPGKPVWFGADEVRKTVFFGLPGNPVSALVGACLFVRPYVNALNEGKLKQPVWSSVRTGEDMSNPGKFTFFAGGRLSTEGADTRVFKIKTSGSGDVVRFGPLACLIRLEPHSEVKREKSVQLFLPFRW